MFNGACRGLAAHASAVFVEVPTSTEVAGLIAEFSAPPPALVCQSALTVTANTFATARSKRVATFMAGRRHCNTTLHNE